MEVSERLVNVTGEAMPVEEVFYSSQVSVYCNAGL
jgi:hypothetical protein